MTVLIASLVTAVTVIGWIVEAFKGAGKTEEAA